MNYQRYIRLKDSKEPTFDVIEHGVDKTTSFAKGWMCPIFKANKPDRTRVENYRPITILNTVYKLFTSVLSGRLAKHAPQIIHQDQAGFVRGRSIFDQVRLAQTMLNYTEATDQNGVIVALDQEKSHDKIDHEYLWKVLKKFNLPESFIDTVKSLYAVADTVVVINGVMSTPFKVTRGVRQGDPLSCLLFDLAIEPLACTMRASTLQGFKVPGVIDKILTSLFADDTTVFLSEHDEFSELLNILDLWCKTSKARFNKDKTQIIPMGTPGYRQTVVMTRTMRPGDPELPTDISIAAEGMAVRTLEAWMGNGADQLAPWTNIITGVEKAFARWKLTHPTLRWKRLIIQRIVGGMTQYLTKAQGMPLDIEKRMKKIIRDYIWDNANASPVNVGTLHRKIKDGGIKLSDMEARNEAIELTWLRSYLDLSSSRPKWAYLADELIKDCTTSVDKSKCSEARYNTFLQGWEASTHLRSLLPGDLKRMLKVARKYNADFHAIKLSRALKRAMPAWYHQGANQPLRRKVQGMIGDCLRDNHRVRTVADLTHTRANLNRINCACAACKRDRQNQCAAPNRCTNLANEILTTLEPKWDMNHEPQLDNLTLTERRKAKNRGHT